MMSIYGIYLCAESQCVIGRQGLRIQIHVARHRVGREPRNHYLCFRIDINALSVYAPRHECAVIVVQNPPLIVIAPVGKRLVSGGGKCLGLPPFRVSATALAGMIEAVYLFTLSRAWACVSAPRYPARIIRSPSGALAGTVMLN
jgi:hypothetical protein